MEVSSQNSNYSEPLSTVTILQLPNELLTLIFEYLKGCDVISFASTCKRFSSLSQSVTHLNLENRNSSLGKSLPIVNSFFRSHVNPSLLRSCNLNGCYWISASTLKSLLIKCSQLEELRVAETMLTIREIVAVILLKCSKVTKLSFSLKAGGWLSFDARPSKQKHPSLCRLKSVEMIVADSSCPFSEILHFLQSCENVEDVAVCKAWISRAELHYNFKLSYSDPIILKSLVFVSEPLAEPNTNHQVSTFYEVREDGSNLTTFWCNFLQLHNSENLNNLTSVAWNTPELRNQPLPISVLHPGLQLGHLESYWEPEPILMRSVLNSPTKLKLISAFYDSNNFQNFCENHPQLQVLKLNSWTLTSPSDKSQSPKVWNQDSWKNLSRLRILSLNSTLISEPKLPYLKSIVQSCPLIQELEIMGTDCRESYTRYLISGNELSSIALLGPHLKRLTLSHFYIEDGLFLEDILKSCSELQSLRLKSLDRRGYSLLQCCYETNLITALPFTKKLKTFCLFQTNFHQIELLLDSLESCTCMSRLSIVCPSFEPVWKISKEDFCRRLIRFCDKLSQLVALFCYSRVPYEHCEEAIDALRKKFTTERPAFRVDVQSMLNQDGEIADDGQFGHSYLSREFPVMYKDLLTSCQSRVALFPFNCNTFLQRTK